MANVLVFCNRIFEVDEILLGGIEWSQMGRAIRAILARDRETTTIQEAVVLISTRRPPRKDQAKGDLLNESRRKRRSANETVRCERELLFSFWKS